MSDYGPKMAALTEMQRLFVEHYVKSGGDNASASARQAGYSPGSDGGTRTEGSRLIHSPRILAAIREETERQLSLDLPEAQLALAKLLRNEQHKDHFAAIKLLLGTQGISSINKTEHVHTLDTQSLAAQIKSLEAQLPADMRRRLTGPTIIDITPEEDWRAP